ncbi:MAG: hypothetical protein PHQ52_03405 [Candidatus Omnitrophica bacterium]|nr:hypothetical protein [Candidatus Omnitrophota bacterium]
MTAKKNLFISRQFVTGICFVLFFTFVFFWQNNYRQDPSGLKKSTKQLYRGVCGVGVEDEYKVFVYGLYYWNIFPLYPIRAKLPAICDDDNYFYSQKGADEIFQKGGFALANDKNGLIRCGVGLAYFVPWLIAKIRGNIQLASFLPFSFWVFIISLFFLNLCFWINKQPLFAVLLTLLIGSYKFQLYNIYCNENIFSYYISIFMCLLGFSSFFIFDKQMHQWQKYSLVLVSAMTGSIFSLIRMDVFAVMPAYCFMLLFYKKDKLFKRILLIVFFVMVFLGVRTFGKSYLADKKAYAIKVCEEKGGDWLDGGSRDRHVFWHTLWVNAQEFGKNDPEQRTDFFAAYEAKQVLKNKYGIKTPPIPYINKQRDLFLFSHPMYDKIMCELFFEDVKENPIGFIKALVQRTFITLNGGPNVEITIGRFNIRFPSNIWIFLLLSIVLLTGKMMNYLKIFVYFLCTMLIPVFVGIIGNFQYMAIVIFFLYAFTFMVIIQKGIDLLIAQSRC